MWAEVATLAGFCAYLFFFGLGALGLVGADEPRYAQIAREMLARHNWITPVLNGVPWLEKPILYYWSAMLSYSVFGVSDWAARLPSAVLASAMVVAVYLFTRRLRPGAQLDAALIAASCAGIIGFGRGASTDMPLTATFVIGMLAWYTWLDTGRKRWLAGFYVLMALGTLAKGPVAPFLAALVIVVFSLARGDLRLVGRTLWWPGVLLYVAVALPWYVAVQWQTPQFFYVFFFQHNVERFTTNLYRHRQPLWYYLPVLLVALLPWTVYVIAAITAAFRHGGGIHSAASATTSPEQRGDDPLRLFLLVWLAAPVIFFSFSESKLPGYILPSLPPCAILLADYLWRKLRKDTDAGWGLPLAHAAIGGLLLALTLLAPYRIVRAAPTSQAELIAAGAGAMIFLLMVAALRARGLLMLRFVTLVPVVLGLAFVVRVVAPMVDATQSARPVARELDRIDHGQTPLAAFQVRRELRYGLNFYRNQPVEFYEQGEVPAAAHLLVAREGSEQALRAFLPARHVSLIGHFARQHLDYYWVSSAPAHHTQ